MKKKFLSFLLAVMLTVSMIPITSLTASAVAAAPTEAQPLGSQGMVDYSEGVCQYFTYLDRLYKINYSNMTGVASVQLAPGILKLCRPGSTAVYLFVIEKNYYYGASFTDADFPMTPGESASCYHPEDNVHSYVDFVIDHYKPIATITCLALEDEPTWTWDGTKSATAVLKAKTENVCVKMTTNSSATTTKYAKSCQEKNEVTYKVSASFGGSSYVDTKVGDGKIGPHDLVYSASDNVITESCSHGCDYEETATLGPKWSVPERYTGDPKRDALKVTYSSGWQGNKTNIKITYSNNINVGTASGSITMGGATAIAYFNILNGKMSNIKADDVFVTYNEVPHSIVVNNVPENAKVSYSTDKTTYSQTNPTFTEMGEHTVYYKVEKDNYDPVKGSAKVVISQAENEWTKEPGIEGWTYGQDAKAPNKGTPKFGSEVKVEYKLAADDNNKYSTTVPTSAGNYKVRFSVEGNENYTVLSKEVDLTIGKANVTVTANNDSKTYGENDPNFTWKLTSGAFVGSDTLVIDLARETGENATTYKIKQVENANANPNYDITFVDGTFTINKKTIGIRWGATDFTYDKTKKLPTATATGTEFSDKIVLTVEGGQINAGTDHTATVTGITGDKKDNYQLPTNVTTTFVIRKADQTAPSNLKGIAANIDGHANGKITGVDSTMQYRRDGETAYHAITGTELTNLADGTYYIRYKSDSNHNASADTPIVINKGQKLTVTVPKTQVGYTLSVNKTELVWNDSVELTFALADGYSKLNTFAVKVNGNLIVLNENGKYTVTNAQSDIAVTVEGVADITAPTGEIKLGKNSWKQFLNNITFGLFFKDTQEVTVTATDSSGGTVTIEYLLSDKELTEEELATSTFTVYNNKFSIEPNNKYVIYAKLTDKTGNVAYINSNGIVLDNIVPVISGVVNGKTYCKAQTVTVSDKYDVTVTVNDEPVTLDTNGKFTLSPAKGTQKIVAKDQAGNVSVAMIVTVNDGHEGGTATCTKKAVCKHCSLEYGEVDNSNHDLEHNKENAATVTGMGNTEYWYCKDCSKNFSDKDGKNVIDLKDTVISKLAPEIIDGKGQSLMAGEKKDLTFRSNAAYSDFIRVEVDGKTVDEKNYTKKEGSTVVTLKADYVATLSAGEHTLGIVSESGTATTTFTVNAKVVNNNTSPTTGDNSHMTMWFALLFVSGGLLTATGIYSKKKKYSTIE